MKTLFALIALAVLYPAYALGGMSFEVGPFNAAKDGVRTSLMYGKTFGGGSASQTTSIGMFATTAFRVMDGEKKVLDILSLGGSLATNVSGQTQSGNVGGDLLLEAVNLLDMINTGLSFRPPRWEDKAEDSLGWFFGASYVFKF